MNTYRKIAKSWKSKVTMEGAGVRLKRAFGYPELSQFDPFLLLDDFHSENPDDYLAGFPRHPHRGIETVTYMLHGKVRHGDSMGNSGIIQGGDIQWMTAGSGIIHEEMPEKAEGLLWGFQLWVNLPSAQKMMHPRYQNIQSSRIPEVSLDGGVRVKVICGSINEVTGPVRDIIVDPEYLDITIPAGSTFEHRVKDGYTVFSYVLEGEGSFEPQQEQTSGAETLLLFEKTGEQIRIAAADGTLRVLLLSGKPLAEPIAWHGPIVMNTKDELETAFQEYREGTFMKHGKVE
ncbi:MAG: pirin family protein [bacterium]|nr:pirin family protein [bacterium]